MNINNLGKYALILLSIRGILPALMEVKTIPVIIAFIITLIIGWLFIERKRMFKFVQIEKKLIVIVFFYYSIFVLIHGAFISRTYEQWRYLLTVFLPILLLPGILLISSVPSSFFNLLKVLLKISLPLSFTYLFMGRLNGIENSIYVSFTSFVYLLILFIPYFRLKYKLFILFVSGFSLFLNLGNRSNLISFIVVFLILILSYLTNKFKIKFSLFKSLWFVFIFFPIFLSAYASATSFNPFKYLEKENRILIKNANGEINMTTDSRTTIYLDALSSINSGLELLFGNSPVKKYQTHLAKALKGYDEGRMGGSEAAILNLLQWGGIFYVTIGFLLFYFSSYFAIFQSRNNLIRSVGLYISFRWMYLFIESPLHLNFLWISVFIAFGICLSKKIREMQDNNLRNVLKRL